MVVEPKTEPYGTNTPQCPMQHYCNENVERFEALPTRHTEIRNVSEGVEI